MQISIDDLEMLGHTGNNPEMAYNRGVLYKNQNRIQEAINDFTEAINLDPTYLKAYRERANCLKHLQRYNEAIQDYFKVYNSVQDDITLIIAIVDTHRLAKKFEFAKNMAYAGMLLAPLNSEIYLYRGLTFLDENKFEFGISDLLAGLGLNNKDGNIIYSIAQAFHRMNMFKEAIIYYTKYINEINGIYTPYAYYNRGIQHNELNDFETFKMDIFKSAELGFDQAKQVIEEMHLDKL